MILACPIWLLPGSISFSMSIPLLTDSISIAMSRGLRTLKLTCILFSFSQLTNRQHIFAVIEAFKGYDNFMAVFAGNEVVNDDQSAAVSPRYQKAVIRDLKNYIAAHCSRAIPVGYSAADDLKVSSLSADQINHSIELNFLRI